MDGNNFHSTVLQRPRSQHERDDERDRQSQHRHDTLNSGSPNQAPPPLPLPASGSAHRHNESSFRLRSPSGGASDYQHHSSHYASPTSSHHRHSLHLQSPPRPALPSPVNHYMAPAKPQGSPPSGGPVAPTLPPPAGLAPPQTSAANMGAGHHHHHPTGPSPLHPPPAYFPPSDHRPRDNHSSAGTKRSFYDPTTDISTSERRVSDSWQDTTPKVSKQSVTISTRVGALAQSQTTPKFTSFVALVKHHTTPLKANTCRDYQPRKKKKGNKRNNNLPELTSQHSQFTSLFSSSTRTNTEIFPFIASSTSGLAILSPNCRSNHELFRSSAAEDSLWC